MTMIEPAWYCVESAVLPDLLTACGPATSVTMPVLYVAFRQVTGIVKVTLLVSSQRNILPAWSCLRPPEIGHGGLTIHPQGV